MQHAPSTKAHVKSEAQPYHIILTNKSFHNPTQSTLHQPSHSSPADPMCPKTPKKTTSSIPPQPTPSKDSHPHLESPFSPAPPATADAATPSPSDQPACSSPAPSDGPAAPVQPSSRVGCCARRAPRGRGGAGGLSSGCLLHAGVRARGLWLGGRWVGVSGFTLAFWEMFAWGVGCVRMDGWIDYQGQDCI